MFVGGPQAAARTRPRLGGPCTSDSRRVSHRSGRHVTCTRQNARSPGGAGGRAARRHAPNTLRWPHHYIPRLPPAPPILHRRAVASVLKVKTRSIDAFWRDACLTAGRSPIPASDQRNNSPPTEAGILSGSWGERTSARFSTTGLPIDSPPGALESFRSLLRTAGGLEPTGLCIPDWPYPFALPRGAPGPAHPPAC